MLSTALTCGLALVVVATDEGGVGWPERMGRVAPLVPLASAIAFGWVCHRARQRGEALALASLGSSTLRWQAPIAAASLLPTAVAASALAWRLPLGGLFPAVPLASACSVHEGGVFRCEHLGLGLRGEAIELFPLADAMAPTAAASAIAGGLAVAAMGLLLVTLSSAWSATRLAAFGLLALAETAVCQGVGARALHAGYAVMLPASVLVLLLLGTGLSRWSTRRALRWSCGRSHLADHNERAPRA